MTEEQVSREESLSLCDSTVSFRQGDTETSQTNESFIGAMFLSSKSEENRTCRAVTIVSSSVRNWVVDPLVQSSTKLQQLDLGCILNNFI